MKERPIRTLKPLPRLVIDTRLETPLFAQMMIDMNGPDTQYRGASEGTNSGSCHCAQEYKEPQEEGAYVLPSVGRPNLSIGHCRGCI